MKKQISIWKEGRQEGRPKKKEGKGKWKRSEETFVKRHSLINIF